MKITDKQIALYFAFQEKQLLLSKNSRKIELTREWTRKFPREAGVYVIREGKKICYVGETGSIRGRMADLLNTRNHVIRRSIGHTEFANHAQFEKATSQKNFHSDIEKLLQNWLTEKLTISILVVDIGRKELEEVLFDKYKPKYNNKGKRNTPQSRWEKMQQILSEIEL